MVRMYFRRKKEYDYGRIIGRLYRYGKVQIAIFITEEEDKAGFLKYFRDTIKRRVNPSEKRKWLFASTKASELHNYLTLHPLEQKSPDLIIEAGRLSPKDYTNPERICQEGLWGSRKASCRRSLKN